MVVNVTDMNCNNLETRYCCSIQHHCYAEPNHRHCRIATSESKPQDCQGWTPVSNCVHDFSCHCQCQPKRLPIDQHVSYFAIADAKQQQ